MHGRFLSETEANQVFHEMEFWEQRNIQIENEAS